MQRLAILIVSDFLNLLLVYLLQLILNFGNFQAALLFLLNNILGLSLYFLSLLSYLFEFSVLKGTLFFVFFMCSLNCTQYLLINGTELAGDLVGFKVIENFVKLRLVDNPH